MKFLLSEHADIKSAIEKQQIPYSNFSFTKKRGRIYIRHMNYPISFVFMRKTETLINKTGNWEKQILYQWSAEEISGESTSWEDLMASFNQWLKYIPN